MKFSVVPESSARWTGVIARSGSVASGFVAAIAGSFQLVIVPAKIPAIVAGSRLSSSTPSRLKMTAIGEMYSGSCRTVGVGSARGEAAGGDLLVVERAVGTGVVARALEEGVATRAGAGGVVVDRDVGVGRLELGDPRLLSGVHARTSPRRRGCPRASMPTPQERRRLRSRHRS